MKHGQKTSGVKEEHCCTSLCNVNKVAEKAIVLRSLHANSNGSFSLFAFSKGRGLPVKHTKTLSLSFTLRCSPLNRQKDGLEGQKKRREESQS